MLGGYDAKSEQNTKGTNKLIGNVLIATNVVFISMYMVTVKHLVRKHKSITVTAYADSIAALHMSVFAVSIYPFTLMYVYTYVIRTCVCLYIFIY